jgi:hypothetical protein
MNSSNRPAVRTCRAIARFMLVAIVAATGASTLGARPARAEAFSCSVFEKGSNKSKLLFTGKRTEKDGNAQTAFLTPDGKEAVTEEIFFKGGKLSKYLLHQKQLGEEGSLEIRDDKIFFTYTKEGETQRADEDRPDNLIIGPTTVDFIQANWDKLMAGDSVASRFAALDRRETVGFKFFKEKDVDHSGKPAVQIKMKPSSFVIAAIVKPLLFTFDKGTKRLVELNGRALPKQNVDGKWKDLDADLVYKY